MFMHYDILYIGTDENVWDELKLIAEENDLTILNVRKTTDIRLINDDLSFTIVLTELHINYNYEGFTIERLGLKYSFLAILTDEITENSIHVSECLFEGVQKYLVLKRPNIIYSFLKSEPINFYSKDPSIIPIEA